MFDVHGPALVAEGDELRERPTVVLVRGGPGFYDHTAGHFTWVDAADRFWPAMIGFVDGVGGDASRERLSATAR